MRDDQLTFFVHKTIRYVPRRGRNNTLREVVSPTVSGLVFLQGSPQKLQAYLDEKIPGYKLCKNCSTGRVATIPCSQMEPFMRIAETDPNRIRFLLRPFVYYAQNRTLLRITTGEYAGLEGYVIRIARDRKLVMDVGGMSIAISGIHAERFEEVDKKPVAPSSAPTFYQRNLHERNAFVDRYFHPVRTPQEVTAQTENIEMLRRQTLSDVLRKKLDTKDALEIFSFIMKKSAITTPPSSTISKTTSSPSSKPEKSIPRTFPPHFHTPRHRRFPPTQRISLRRTPHKLWVFV